MVFASLTLDREPLQWAELPQALLLWAQNAGGVAVLGVFLWVLARMIQREPVLALPQSMSSGRRGLLTNLFVAGATISILGYGFVMFVWIVHAFNANVLANWFPRTHPLQRLTYGDYCLAISGTCAIILVAAPVLMSALTRFSAGRIWAITKLSWKEAVRGRIVWVFGAMALVLLFADWFVPYKPEDQVRNYVRMVYWSMAPLFLLTSGLLGAFSIPTDVKNNTIHTIVTKPVEKIEIVLGRFFGYGALLTVGLVVVSCLSLIYVVRGVNEEAKHESFKARVAVYCTGEPRFAGTKNPQKAQNVGREWGTRTYIMGVTRTQREIQYAIWDFADLPASLADRDDPVRFEYSFDIFRLSKGEEGKGLQVTFSFTDGTVTERQLEERVEKMNQERDQRGTEARKKIDASPNLDKEARDRKRKEALDEIEDDLRSTYRIYQVKGEEVFDFHTQQFYVPGRFFQVLLANPEARKLAQVVPLRVYLSVDSKPGRETQLLGVSRPDFYLLTDEYPFWLNFLKGVVGMWCTHMLVLGVAVACSTYLSSVISLLATLFLYGAGLFGDYLKEVAERKVEGGGPFQALIRVTAQMPTAVQLDNSPTTNLVLTIDNIFSWWIGRFLNMVPDINRHDLHQYVANGFDIAWINVLLLDNLVPLCGYMLPWVILAYYLMKYREIANPS